MNGLRNKEKLTKAVEKIWGLKINRDIKKRLMDELIWKIGEAPNGKYKVRYRSEGAMNIKDVKKLHHEHVISRKRLKEELVDAKNLKEVNRIINKIETCIVTRKEHKKLDNKIEGWKRYRDAGVKVFDVFGETKRIL